jgi:hypothetical protein
MPQNSELIAAYNAALYVVFGEPELVIRIGEPNPDLDALLEADGATSAAYVTASNPGGIAAGDGPNNIACLALSRAFADTGYSCYEGEGRDPAGVWPSERSVLIVGMPRGEAEALGRRLEQIAIVFVEKGKAPELVLLDD